MDIMRSLDIQTDVVPLVGTAGDTAGAILGARKAFLITGLLVCARRLGCASGALINNIALVDGVLVVGL